MSSLYSVEIHIGWIPSQVALTQDAKKAIAEARGVAIDKIKGSYSILGGNSLPFIKEGKKIRQSIFDLRDQLTIPKFVKAGEIGGAPMILKVAGNYLLPENKVGVFLQSYNQLRDLYTEWTNKLTDGMYDQIKEYDRLNLASDWVVVQDRYPTREQLMATAVCSSPIITPYISQFSVPHVSSDMVQEMCSTATQLIQNSIEGAVEVLYTEFEQLVQRLAKSCSPKVRLNPPFEHPWHSMLNNAEVLEKTEVDESGLLNVKLQPVTYDSVKAKFVNLGDPTAYQLMPEKFAALRPLATDEYRALHESSFEAVFSLVSKFDNLKDSLTSSSRYETLESLVGKINNSLNAIGKDSGSVASAVRNSGNKRKAVGEAMSELEKSIRLEVAKKSSGGLKRRVIFQAS